MTKKVAKKKSTNKSENGRNLKPAINHFLFFASFHFEGKILLCTVFASTLCVRAFFLRSLSLSLLLLVFSFKPLPFASGSHTLAYVYTLENVFKLSSVLRRKYIAES